jgi:hypothetical protein
MLVILNKGPKGERIWEDSPARAIQRANALCDLHSCEMEVFATRIMVDASAYYTKKEAKSCSAN